MSSIESPKRINIEEPRYDQGTYSGRARHFFITTNPLNIFATGSQLEQARQLIQQYRTGKEPHGLLEHDLWKAKNLYDSAFHPDTGEKMFILGRMSSQVPMNMFITGCMLTFYKSTPAVVFWQWFNQSFNAIVNYTNRSGEAPISVQRLGVSYVAATAGAMGTALGLNRLVKSMPPLVGRYVPFAAVAAANCINIPCMRSRELTHGIPIFTEDGERVGQSTKAAQKAITQVVISRVVMASPGMMLPPLIMSRLEKGAFLKRFPWMTAPIQTGIVGAILIFATPMCCALFPQKSSIAVSSLESELQEKLKERSIIRVYYNKGL